MIRQHKLTKLLGISLLAGTASILLGDAAIADNIAVGRQTPARRQKQAFQPSDADYGMENEGYDHFYGNIYEYDAPTDVELEVIGDVPVNEDADDYEAARSDGWHAWIDLGENETLALNVEGEVELPNPGYTAELVPLYGMSDEDTLVLSLEVEAPDEDMYYPAVVQEEPISYVNQFFANDYDNVVIRDDSGAVLADLEVRELY